MTDPRHRPDRGRAIHRAFVADRTLMSTDTVVGEGPVPSRGPMSSPIDEVNAVVAVGKGPVPSRDPTSDPLDERTPAHRAVDILDTVWRR